MSDLLPSASRPPLADGGDIPRSDRASVYKPEKLADFLAFVKAEREVYIHPAVREEIFNLAEVFRQRQKERGR